METLKGIFQCPQKLTNVIQTSQNSLWLSLRSLNKWYGVFAPQYYKFSQIELAILPSLKRLAKMPGKWRGVYAEENAFAICPDMRWPPWLHVIPDMGYTSGLGLRRASRITAIAASLTSIRARALARVQRGQKPQQPNS